MEDLFKCPLCEVACGNKGNLLSHVDKHKGFPISCIICHSAFKNKFAFDYHLVSELCKKTKKHVGKLRYCPQCPQTFPNRRHLDKHVEGHRRNNCQYCEARFTTRKELTFHMAQEHKMKLEKAKYQCQFCERCFVKQVTLFNHYNQHANGKFVCQGCGLFLDTKEEFETHRERHEQERPWKCTRCATTFSRRQQYVVHMESHEKYQCKTCNMGFAAKATLQEHARACQNQSGRESQHECPECGKIFSREGQLKLHLKAHTGEEAYTCLVCKKGLQTAEDYNQHIQATCHRIAEDDPKKPYECQQCDKCFSHDYLLEEHENQMHSTTHTYKCTFCDHSSNSRSNMTRHLALHTEKRRFACNQCGAAFHALTTLKDHCNSVHSQQRHFSCDMCDKMFKLQSDLRRHIQSHSDMRLFKCPYCSHSYKRASHLRRHEESAHRIIFKPRKLQRLGHDENGVLVPVGKGSKSLSGEVKGESSLVPAGQQWTSPATSQGSVFTNPVLSLVDADLGKVITLQEVCTVSDASILATTGDLATTEVLTLPPDDTLTTIVTCADGTTLGSFQSGEMMQTIEVTYDLTFPTSQTLTTVLSSSEPQLVFATPITMSLDQHQTVLTVSEIDPTNSASGKVQLLDAHAASKLPDTIFIEEGRLEGLEEPMLLDGSEPVPHIKIENFSALEETVLQMTAGSDLPGTAGTVSRLHSEQAPATTGCSVLPDDVLTSSSLLRERLISGPKPRPSTLPSLPLVPSQCDALVASAVSSISIPASIPGSIAQPDSGISTLPVSSPVPTTSGADGSHLDPVLSIPNTVKPLYASITVGNIDPDSVIASFSVPNSIQLSCADISSDGTNVEPSVPQIAISESVLSPHSDISHKGAPPSTDITAMSVPNSATDPIVPLANTNSHSSISAFTAPNAVETTISGISTQGIDPIQPLCPDVSDKHCDSDISDMNVNPSIPTLSVDAADVSLSGVDICPSQPQDVSMCIEDTQADLVLASLPISTEDIHPNSSLPIVVQSPCSDEPPNTMMPDFLPQSFPFLNVE
ncbi:hypothetical protein B7P43_G14410 [Cryptotermes secundus]|uniref:C2H2-type domain-containing protein n=1 Tax=Cryptotermes secundus TaxID=105785 RepID=A0A2J7RKM1_9NEOP|nr:zinc finger protein 236 [Cryptotermes secundus]PNF41384.1 hypothetical protein B7P43_G14410 [Cryptotermes secundus]